MSDLTTEGRVKASKMARGAMRSVGLALIVVVAGALLLQSCAVVVNAPAVTVRERHFTGAPTNVILLIGDGMGLSQLTGGKIELGTLNMERMPVGGFATTFAGNRLVTDSAASGTALATGHKSYNGAVSVSMDKRPLKTVLEDAEERGMATGLVVTCSVTHATPAVFAAHVDNRDKSREIARQLVASDVDVLFGGGWSDFVPDSEPGGARTDGRNLLNDLRHRMPVAMSADEFKDLPETDAAAAFFAPGHEPPASSRAVSLRERVTKAMEILSRDKDGFFLMVEGSQIDWAGHENDHNWLMAELADFDEAVGAALDFAEKNGRTLVVVTADHETGAYAVLDGSLERHEVTRPAFGSGDHSAAMVPVLAYGPGSEAFGGIQDNTDIGRTLIEVITGGRPN